MRGYVENNKQTFDDGKNVGLILLDQSKAFDCLPHRLLLCKFNAFGICYEACSLIKSYLCQRFQRNQVIKIKNLFIFMALE